MSLQESPTRRYYSSTGNKPSWGNRGKTEEERRGIAVSVAVNNVFGNLNFTELQDIALNSNKLESLLKLVTTLAELQVKFANSTNS